MLDTVAYNHEIETNSRIVHQVQGIFVYYIVVEFPQGEILNVELIHLYSRRLTLRQEIADHAAVLAGTGSDIED